MLKLASFRDHNALDLVLTALALLAAFAVGALVPDRGTIVLQALVLGGVGLAVLLKPELGLYLMVGLIPLTTAVVLTEGVTTVRLVGSVTLGAWILRKLVRREPLTVPLSGSLALPIVALAFLAVVSGLWSADRDLWALAIPSLLRLALWYFMMVDLITSWKTLRRLMLTILCTGLFSMAIGIHRFFFLDYARGRGGYGTADAFSSLTLVLLPIAFYFLVHGSKPQRIFGWFSVGVNFVALGVSATRTSLLIAPFLLLFQFREWQRAKRHAAIIIALVALIMASPLVPWDLARFRMRELLAGDEITSYGGRGFRWRIAVMEFLDHPFLGVGYGNFGAHYDHYAAQGQPNAMAIGSSAAFGEASSRRDVHSLYFGFLAELGLVGLVGLVWLLATSLRIISRAIAQADKRTWQEGKWLSQALRISMICYLVYSLALSTGHSKLLWLLLALTEVAHRLATSSLEGESSTQDTLEHA